VVTSPNSLRLHRLNKSDQFEQIVRQGKKVSAGSLVFKYIESPDGAHRLAFVVRKKCGNAVFRNRIRRVLRHQFYERFAYAEPARWGLIQYFGSSTNFSSESLHAEADEVLKKLGWVPKCD